MLCGTLPAFGEVIPVTGSAQLLGTAPLSLLQDALQSDTNDYVFAERKCVQLATAVNVSTQASGTYSLAAQSTPATIAAGTLIDSFLLHSDRVSANTNYIGSITFASPILGVIVTNAALNNTGAVFAAPGKTYATTGRGLELNGMGGGDTFTIFSDYTTFSFDFRTAMGLDEVRILTAAVPEPSSWSLLAGALGGLAWLRLKKRSALKSPALPISGL